METPIEVQCPWCGESFTTFADPSVSDQTYTEDCQVCCRPIVMRMQIGEDGEVSCGNEREN